MNQLIKIIPLIIILFLNSCGTKETPFKRKYIGYFYNSVDSTPFVNTKFKVYHHQHSGLGIQEDKEFQQEFYTDNKGYFDVFTDIAGGQLVWPSYFDGSAYVGPKDNSVAKSQVQDDINKLTIVSFDTIYTTLYH